MQMRFLRAVLAAFGTFLFLALSSLWFLTDATTAQAGTPPSSKITLHDVRTSPLDLELGGDLVGTPAGTVRYVRREDLLALPQTTFTVSDDANFTAPTQVSGVP